MGGAPYIMESHLPERTSDTVPEALGQTHCARGAAAGGLLYTRPFIRVTGAADFGRRPTGGGAGSQGRSPSRPSSVDFLGEQEVDPPAGAGPGNSSAR